MPRKALALVLAAVVLYGMLRAGALIAGPALSLKSPVDYASYPGGVVTIAGVASHAAILTINGAPALHEESGSFSKVRTFPAGGSILTIRAADRFGRGVTVVRTIYVP